MKWRLWQGFVIQAIIAMIIATINVQPGTAYSLSSPWQSAGEVGTDIGWQTLGGSLPRVGGGGQKK